MTDYTTRVTALTVLPVGEKLYREMAKTVSIETVSIDYESAVEFVVVTQVNRTESGSIAITPEEWPRLRAAMFARPAHRTPSAH